MVYKQSRPKKGANSSYLILLPIKLNFSLGLHTAIASSKHCLVTRTKFLDSSSTLPTQ